MSATIHVLLVSVMLSHFLYCEKRKCHDCDEKKLFAINARAKCHSRVKERMNNAKILASGCAMCDQILGIAILASTRVAGHGLPVSNCWPFEIV
jgi:hypothetical protein